MKLMNQLEKLVKNKVVLYGILFLTVTNVFGYLMTANYEAVVFFALVYYLSHEFTKNNIIVCLIALGATNLLLTIVQGRKIYEAFAEEHEHEKGGKDAKGKDAKGKDAKGKDAKGKDAKDKAAKGKDAKGKEEEPKIDKEATKKATAGFLVENLDSGKLDEHMSNLNQIESLITKQEGLVGSLGKIENMMDRLQAMNKTMSKKTSEGPK